MRVLSIKLAQKGYHGPRNHCSSQVRWIISLSGQ